MRSLRAHLAAFALIVIASQAAGVAASQWAYYQAMAPLSETACTCAHGPHGDCPMHKPKPAAPGGSKFCAGCPTGTDAVLTTILGPLGMLVDTVRPVPAPGAAGTPADPESAPLPQPHDPGTPPPRR
jgi:hypothetical protein